jgi:hypothetical protein
MSEIRIRAFKRQFPPAEPAVPHAFYLVQESDEDPIEVMVTNIDGLLRPVYLNSEALQLLIDAAVDAAFDGIFDSTEFTGVPKAPTPDLDPDHPTQIANKEFVYAVRDEVLGSAPGQLDTLQELAAALNDDEDFANTITTLIATKEASANKDTENGYVGISTWRIKFRNIANTFTSFLRNTNTAARTYTFQDRNGTIADDTDIAAATDRSNHTGSQSAETISDFVSAVATVAPAETVSSIGTLINGADEATVDDTDLLAMAEGSTLKKLTWASLKAALKTYFDTLYQAAAGGGSVKAYAAADITYNNTATFANTALNVSVEAAGVYQVDISLPWVSNGQSPKFDLNGGTATVTTFQGLWRSKGSFAEQLANVTSIATSFDTNVAATETGYAVFRGVLIVNAAGTLILRAAQRSASATDTLLKAGSNMILNKLD